MKPVIVPIVNGRDITDRSRETWVIDFARTPDIEPKKYKQLYDVLYEKWQKELNDPDKKRKPKFRENWWEFRTFRR